MSSFALRGHVARAAAVVALLGGGQARAESPPTIAGTHYRVLETASGLELRYSIRIPEGYSADRPAPLVLSLHHGFDRSRPFPEYFGRGMLHSLVAPGLRELEAVIVAPDSHGNRWGDEVIETGVIELVERTREEYAIDPGRIAVVGFSMGGRGSWQYAARHPQLFTAVIPIASRVDPATAQAVEAPVFVIHSRDDGRIPIEPMEELVAALQEKGRRVELLAVKGLQHHETPRYSEPLQRAAPWLEKIWKAARP